MSNFDELKMVKNEYNIPTEQLEYYKSEIMRLLPQYRYKSDRHYAPTDKGLNALLDVYNKEKGWMYPYFMNHPNYIGNGKIAFSSDYHRKVNVSGCQEFLFWVNNNLKDIYLKKYEARCCGMTYREAENAFRRLDAIYEWMKRIENTKLGSGSATCRVNGMTLKEIANEHRRLYYIKSKIEDNNVYAGNDHYLPAKKYEDLRKLQNFVSAIYDNPHMLTTTEEVDNLNELTKSLDLRIVAGQKFSRIIGKFCRKLGIDKLDDYQQKFAKFGDDINELAIRRHTVISINPIDYLTMSFGNSWSSCHTIDKLNDRNCPNNYRGMYSGGTLSYMLDGASIVFYTVDKKYDGTDFEFEPKVNRCMFHIGEDKIIQGRVYPQNNDGDQTIYNEIRAIMQKTVSEMLNANNLWILKQGTSACAEMTESRGAHYRDYTNFSNCNVSWLKPSEGKLKNTNRIIIGHRGICPTCGTEHGSSDSIICSDCFNEIKRCPHCGRRVEEDDHIEIDGQVYCSTCARYCIHHQRYEIDTRMMRLCTNARMARINRRNAHTTYSVTDNYVCVEAINENPDRYRPDADTGCFFDTESWAGGVVVHYFYNGNSEGTSYYASREYAEYLGYKEAYNGKWYHKDNLFYDRHTGVKAYIPQNEWNYKLACWNGIADEVRQHNEMLEQRAERRAAREARRNAQNAA